VIYHFIVYRVYVPYVLIILIAFSIHICYHHVNDDVSVHDHHDDFTNYDHHKAKVINHLMVMMINLSLIISLNLSKLMQIQHFL